MRRAALAGVLLLALAAPAGAQAGARPPAQEITESQRRLEEIRRERAQLREELRRIRGEVNSASTEMRNIQRQAATSAELLRELQFQMEAKQRAIDEITRELVSTQDGLAERKALLNRRMRDIYKRGPLQTTQVLLAAESFSDLINRYKYLYLIARRDRVLVTEVQQLERQLSLREMELRRSLDDIRFLQTEREQEHSSLQGLAANTRETLSTLRTYERTTAQRTEELTAEERRVTGLIATLERRRREAERAETARRERERVAAAAPTTSGRTATPAAAPRRTPTPVNASGASTLTTADIGSLAWPVSGNVLYRFGRATQPNGTTIRWNGIGIGAAAGSPVRAVEAGTVVMAGPFEGYGPTVVVSHGGGYYSLYLHLRDVGVREGTEIARGQTVGTVGGEGTAQGPHIEFQIRAPGGQAVDPASWLRGRR